jgi:membrane protein DedA with SNARE-associated domain
MTNLKTAILHGLNVAGHILFAAIIVGLGVLLNNNPAVTSQFSSFLIQFGLPTAIVNIVVAAVVKFIQTEAAKENADTTTPQNPV